MADTITSNQNIPIDRETLQQWLINNLAQHINAKAEDIEVDVSFEHYGLDSEKTIELSGDLSEWLGIFISPEVCYDYPTVEKVTQYLLTQLQNQSI